MSTTTTAALAQSCTTRGAALRSRALDAGFAGREQTPTVLAYRLAWDAPAAGEYPRPMIQDAADVEATFGPGPLTDAVWHHVAGACIIGQLCDCPHPAFHRDALGDIAREIRPA